MVGPFRVSWRRRGAAVLLSVAAWLGGAGAVQAQEGAAPPAAAAEPAYAGTATCATCHGEEQAAWRGSHHDLAMQPATPDTVLGDFDGATVTVDGVSTTFLTEGDRFIVRTEDVPGGGPADFTVDHVFGVQPLQQVLIGMPDGRLQAFGLAWDTRPADEGGKRWFPLYPDDPPRPGDPVHWAGRNQTWNWMCADCHSTGLDRGYEAETDSYQTTWVEIDVGCEACHGPGADHVAWAEAGADWTDDPGAGLAVDMSRGGFWRMPDDGRGIAELAEATMADGAGQVDTCAACHSRRRPLTDNHHAGTPFLDDHVPALLDEGLYHADGQILEEVFVWGSFVQSPMYRAGVVCSDCHEPHSGDLIAEGNAVCGQCHQPSRFDTADHHRHDPTGEAGQCVACHMPDRTYMVVDPRRDHSFRVPRPDLAASLGTPDACTMCHTDRDAGWAAGTVAAWYDGGRSGQPHFATTLQAGRSGTPGAWHDLAALAQDDAAAGIVRATALSMLPRYAAWLTPDMVSAMARGLDDDDPLVRLASTEALGALPLDQTMEPLIARLDDPVRSVRIEAARQLAALPPIAVPPTAALQLDRAIDEVRDSLEASAERPDALVGLGNLEAARGRSDAAEAAFRRALSIDPGYVPAYANLADLVRQSGDEAAAVAVLREGLDAAPEAAELHHALGLAEVRLGRYEAAVASLRRAWEAAADQARFGYVYGIALGSTGDTARAIDVLADVVDRHPSDRPSREALIDFLLRADDLERARKHAEVLASMAPDDPRAADLVRRIDRTRR